MSRIIIALVLAFSLSGCKKIKENIEEKQAMQYITVGQWRVVVLMQGTVDRSNEFVPYTFQFRTNYTVDAIKNGSTEISGTWMGNNANARVTIQSSFPQNATATLLLLNGLFDVQDAGLNYVEATKTDNGVLVKLRMEKL